MMWNILLHIWKKYSFYLRKCILEHLKKYSYGIQIETVSLNWNSKLFGEINHNIIK